MVVAAVVQRCDGRKVTRSQNTTTRRGDARFYDKRRCKYLPKLQNLGKWKVLTEVCFAVSMGLVAGGGDGDEESIERD